ncbi:MAG: hypothetical protein KA523_02235 [Flavobacterium sp.]|nr:hypothetical protein [Flavobacterium sp.]
MNSEFGAWILDFGVWNLGFGIWDFGIWSLGFGVWSFFLQHPSSNKNYYFCLMVDFSP